MIFLASDSRGLIPVYFGEMHRAIGQSNMSDPLALLSATASIDLSKAGELPDARPCGECFDIGNFAQNLEVHQQSVSKSCDSVNGAGIAPGAHSP